MKKLTLYLMPLLTLLLVSSCSNFRAEKEIVTVPTIVEAPRIEAPIIQVVRRPDPIQMKNSDIVVITESNLQEVIDNIKEIQGELNNLPKRTKRRQKSDKNTISLDI